MSEQTFVIIKPDAVAAGHVGAIVSRYEDAGLRLAAMEFRRIEPEFADLVGRVVVTAEPASLARFASSSHVVSHQRRLLGAARGQG